MKTRSTDRLFARYCRTGDAVALATVFDRTAPEVLRLASHFAADAAEAEDLLQDTFLRAIERAETFQAGERVVPWLLAILVNQARMRRRRRRIEAEAPALEPMPGRDPAAQAHEQDVADRVIATLGAIPPPYREVLERHLQRGQTGTQIGHALGRSPNTVRSQLRRGLQLLRAALPAGFAMACQPSPTRGLPAVRDVVLQHSAAAPALGVAAQASGVGGVLLMKKLLIGAAALLAAAGTWWISTGGRTAPPLVPRHEAPGPTHPGDATASGTDAVVDDGAPRAAIATAEPTPFDERTAAAMTEYSGRVVDHDLAPVADAEVQLFRFDPGELQHLNSEGSAAQRVDFVAAQTRSLADGRFTLTGIAPRAVFAVRANKAECAALRIVEAAPGPGERSDLGDVVLPPPTAFTGVVVGPDDEPIAGATVRAIDLPPLVLGVLRLQHLRVEQSWVIIRSPTGARVVQPPPWLRHLLTGFAFCTTTTDAAGRFELRGVQPGNNVVVASAAGLEPRIKSSVRARPGASKDVGALRLRIGDTAVVNVVDHAGQPVAGAEVLIGATNPTSFMDFAVPAPPTDSSGRTEVTGQSSGRVTVAVRRGPAHPWVVAEPRDVGFDVEVRLPRDWALTLRVESEERFPVAGASIRFAAGRGTPDADLEADLGLRSALEHDPLRTTADGEVTTTLAAADYIAEIRAPGYVDQTVPVVVDGDRTETVTLQAATTGALLVLDPRGHPVRAAEVLASPAGDATDGPSLRCGATDADGRCVITTLGRGDVRFSVRHPGLGIASHVVAWPQELATLVLPDPGTIEGVIVGAGRSTDQSPPRVIASQLGGESPELPRIATTDAEGRFAFRGLTPGQYHVRLNPSLADVRSLGSALQHFMLGTTYTLGWEPHEVTSGGTTRVVLQMNPGEDADAALGSVRGTAFVDGLPAAGRRLVVMHRGLESTAVGADGTFVIEGVSGPTVKVVLYGPEDGGGATSSTLWQRTLPLADAAQLSIDLRTGRLGGRVLDARGQPIAGAEVALAGALADQGDGAKASAQTVTDERGGFAFASVPAGTYEIEALPPPTPQGDAGNDARRGHLIDVAVRPGSPRSDLVVTLPGPGG